MLTVQTSAIAAIGKNTRALGKDNALLWHIKEDMARFKRLTAGTVVIMGRKTWESIPAKFRPLPNRTNIVVTRNPDFKADGAIIAHSISDAIDKARDIYYFETIHCDGEERTFGEIFVIGGAEIYREALPHIDRLHLTLVDSDAEGDAFFPEYAEEFGREIERTESSEGNLKFTYLTLDRNEPHR